MKTDIPVRMISLVLALLVFCLPGCRNYLVPEKGALSLEKARIDIPKDGVGEALWKGKDLDISYAISQKTSELVISGRVYIHDSILMSFDQFDQLVVKCHFLDISGRVLGTADITPHYSTYGKVEGALEFKTVTTTMPGFSSVAFSYFGTVIGRLGESTDSWEIFYFPFIGER